MSDEALKKNVVLSFRNGEKGRKISRLENGKIVIVDKLEKDNVIVGVDYLCDVLDRKGDKYAIAYPKEQVASSKLILTEDGKFVLIYKSNGENIRVEVKPKDLSKVLHEHIGKGKNITVKMIVR